MSLSFLGVGLSYRWSLHDVIVAFSKHIDWLEFTPEHFWPWNQDGSRRLALLAKRFPMVGHGLELSLGSNHDPLEYCSTVKEMLDVANGVWHGDHVCFTQTTTLPIRALTPVPFTEQSLETFVRTIPMARQHLGKPLIVENIAYVVDLPQHTMPEEEFLRRVLLDADCGLLLDLHNLYANSINHRRDPYAILDALPLDRVVQIHLAGGTNIEGIYFDTHASMCPDEVWKLLEYVIPRCAFRGINFEMDGQYPPFSRIAAELDHTRSLVRKHGLASGAI